MRAEISRQANSGLLDIIIHDPPGPSLMMNDLTDPEVCVLAQYIYTNVVQSCEEWTDPIPIEFVDLGGQSNIHTAGAADWRRLVISLLRVVNPLAVLDSLHIAGHA